MNNLIKIKMEEQWCYDAMSWEMQRDYLAHKKRKWKLYVIYLDNCIQIKYIKNNKIKSIYYDTIRGGNV